MTKKLATINIKGKEYVQVKDRIMGFLEQYPNGSITTEKFVDGDIIVFKATVIPDVAQTPIRTFTGHSEAIRGQSGGITGQSPIEVAETSAVGRALGMLGIGIIESVASADEINKVSTGPSYLKKQFQKELSVKQKNMLKIKIWKTGKPMPDEEWFDILDYPTFNASLAKLKTIPETVTGWPTNLDNGDDKNGSSDNIEGEQERFNSPSGFQE